MDLFSTKVAYAASTSFNGFIANVDSMIINPLILLLFALALTYFLYGVFEFIANGDNDEKKTTGKSHMLWGVVGLTIMMGVWAILGIILNTLGINSQINPEQGTVNLPVK
jgi:succinate dehydrogenase/fumarate reductase cytochrome b subunit